MFRTYRRIKRIGKHLILGSSIFGTPVVIAGVCGLIGLAALIYLKRKADGKALCKSSCCGGTRHRHPEACCNDLSDAVFSEEDFTVRKDTDNKATRNKNSNAAKNKSAGSAAGAEKRKKAESASEKKADDKSNSNGKTKRGSGIWIASSTSKTFHKPDCGRVGRISAANRIELTGGKDSLIGQGYKPCAYCIGK